jgi:hypothetical protein
MSKTQIKLNNDEKLMLDKIHVITKIPKNTIKDVFFGLLIANSIEHFGKNDLIIPYICRLMVEINQKATSKGIKANIYLKGEAAESLYNEFVAILDDKITPTEEYWKEKICKKFEIDLDVCHFDS